MAFIDSVIPPPILPPVLPPVLPPGEGLDYCVHVEHIGGCLASSGQTLRYFTLSTLRYPECPTPQ